MLILAMKVWVLVPLCRRVWRKCDIHIIAGEMNNRKREFLIANIRSGYTRIKKFDILVRPASLEDIIDSYEVYEESFQEALDDGLMKTEDMELWMAANGFWTNLDEDLSKKIQKEIENSKVTLYKHYGNQSLVRKERKRLRSYEKQYLSHVTKKNIFYSNTCESYAESNRLIYLVKLCCERRKEIEDEHIDSIIKEYHDSILSEETIRFLARNEPWRSLWSISQNCQLKLFSNEEPTVNQKNLILWSKTYDGVHESMEPPPKVVIDDDDFLDGWFIEKSREREREAVKKGIENKTKNAKISSPKEVFVFTDNEEEAQQIYELNSPEAKNTIRQRMDSLNKSKGGYVGYDKFIDQKEEALSKLPPRRK